MFRKSPPNNMRGMSRVGPIARAMLTELAAQEMR